MSSEGRKAARWLSLENPALRAKAVELIGSDASAMLMVDELMRVRWGEFA